MAVVKAVIFDYGGVLTLAPQESERRLLCALAGGTEPEFSRMYWEYRAAYDAGELDGASYWRCVTGARGTTLTPGMTEELIATDIAMWNRPNPAMLRWAGVLASAGLRLGVISNMHREHAQALRADLRHLTGFVSLALSSELGIAKPDPAIYRHCLQEIDVQPGECLFIDDRAGNVAGAQAVGMHGIVYRSVPQLAADLAGARLIPAVLLAPLGEQ